MKKTELILVIMIVLSFFFRLWHVGSLPTILNRDEAALAYNALLLRETGRDEWGKTWPLALQSFGDYKLPGYPVILVPFFQTFGYADWVVRLPSVIAGTLLVLVSFFFAQNLGFTKKYALLVAFFVATSPIFFFYSRMAFEANVALTLFVGSLTLCLSSKKKQKWWADALAVLIMLGAVFTYNTPLLLLPFFIILVPLWRNVQHWRKWLVPTVGLSLVCVVGFYQLFSLAKQKSGITIFQDETIWAQSVEQRERLVGWQKKILGNRVIFFGGIILNNYAKTMSPKFLVKGVGGHPWHTVPDAGHILITTYVLALVGVIESLFSIVRSLVKRRLEKDSTLKLSLLYVAFVSLLPAVITVDAPHATRSLLFFFSLALFATIGMRLLVDWLPKHISSLFFKAVIIVTIGLSGWYVWNYFTIFPNRQKQFLPGFNKIVEEVDAQHANKPIAIVDTEGFHYILLAWYLRISPERYFQTIIRQQPDKIGFLYGEQLDRYHFIYSPQDRRENEKTVIQWSTWEKPREWSVVEY